jgi:hypothetical protein
MAILDRLRPGSKQESQPTQEIKLNEGISQSELELSNAGVKAEIYTPDGWVDEDHNTVIIWPGLGAGESDSDAGTKLANELQAEGKRVIYMNTQVYGGLSNKTNTPIEDYAKLARNELYEKWGVSNEEQYNSKPKERKVVHVGHSMGAPMAYRAAEEGDELVLAQSALFDVFNKIGTARLIRQAATVTKLCVEANQAMIRDAEEGIREGVIDNALGIGRAASALVLDGNAGALKSVFDELVKGADSKEVIAKGISHMTIITGGRDLLGSVEGAERRVSELHRLGQPGILHTSSVVEDLDHVPMSADSIITAIGMAVRHERPKQNHRNDGSDDGSGIQWAA